MTDLEKLHEKIATRRNEIRLRREALTGTLITEEVLLKDEQDFLDELLDDLEDKA